MKTFIEIGQSGKVIAIKGECKAREFRQQIQELKEALHNDNQ